MNKLTKEKAASIVASIKKHSDDDELAHIKEDSLQARYIACIANGMYGSIEEAVEVGKIVHSTKKIDFARYCA